jgi:hypothetical protein
MQSVSKPPQKK